MGANSQIRQTKGQAILIISYMFLQFSISPFLFVCLYIAEKKLVLPKAGDMVNVPSLNKKAAVLEVDPSKEEVVVQAGILKLKLKLTDIVPC